MNAEFQRIARRDKKAFGDQCKEIEEKNTMGKTRDLFKKIRDTKGKFHAKMGSMKDRNGIDLQEAKILRRGGKNTGVGCHFLLQEIFPTQGLNPGLPDCGQMLSCLSHQGSANHVYPLLIWYLYTCP